MADKKKLTDKEKEDIAFKNMAIDSIWKLGKRVEKIEKYKAKQAKSKARARRSKAAKKTRNLTGFKDSLDRNKYIGFGGNPFDK